MISEKIGPQHLRRKAILNVRQSPSLQVMHNRESGALEYAMADQLKAFGFSQIEILDEDLGRTATGTIARAGFERIVTEVCLGKVSAVAAREVSRFARNSRESGIATQGSLSMRFDDALRASRTSWQDAGAIGWAFPLSPSPPRSQGASTSRPGRQPRSSP